VRQLELDFPRFGGQLGTSSFQRCLAAPLKAGRRHIAEGGVAAAGIVPALDELDDGDARLGLGLERPPVWQLAFECREETLAHRCECTKHRHSNALS